MLQQYMRQCVPVLLPRNITSVSSHYSSSDSSAATPITSPLERWRNKVAVVTGANSGIGLATVKELVHACLTVVGLSDRYKGMLAVKHALPKELQSKFHAVKCDVSSETQVKKVFECIRKELGGVDVLINNAGTARFGKYLVHPDSSCSMERILKVNVMGIVYCTREAFCSMKERDTEGHIVLINSILGHKVWDFQTGRVPPSNMLTPSKHAVTALTETYRQEFAATKSKVKISDICPGLVDTPLISEDMRNAHPTLKPEDVANAIMFVLSTPPHVQVHRVMVKAMGEVC